MARQDQEIYPRGFLGIEIDVYRHGHRNDVNREGWRWLQDYICRVV